MYHRIRNEEKSCSLKKFEQQVKLAKKFNHKLTFDDRLLDQYKILPILKKYNMKGTFFITTNNKICEVHKAWLILNKIELINKIIKKYNIPNTKYLDADSYMYDKPEIANLKHFLRIKQPEILDEVFNSNFNEQEEFEKLYMTWGQIKELHEEGMNIGCHTHTHPFLNKLSSDEQEEEIKISTDIIERKIEKPTSFAFPYGDYDDTTIKLLKKFNYEKVYTVWTKSTNPFVLSRVDTNEVK